MPHPRTRTLAALVAAACAATAVVAAGPALAAEAGTVITARAPSAAVGSIDYAVYLPPGYQDSDRSYPSLYLLHGRGDTMAAWQQVTGDLDELINAGEIQPMVVVMPDAPWNDRGNWYTDSQYTGTAPAGPGQPVETAFTRDLVAHIDATYRTVPDRAARAVGGYSMGGAGALRFTLARQDVFSAGIVLSPASYAPEPPSDSSARDYGAYGWKKKLYWAKRYKELSYPTMLKAVDPALPVHLFIAVGDDEWANPAPADATHDIDFESAKLYNTARRVAGVTAELRILNGGHDWDVWRPAFREAILDVSARLRTAPVEPWTADLLGSPADDRAGGVLPLVDGDLVAVANGGPLDGGTHAGGLDVTLLRRDAAGAVTWRHSLATAAADRSYGLVAGDAGSALVAGYTRGNLDGTHPSGASDDGFVAGVSASGERTFTLQAGDPAAADRFYAIASDGAGGAYVAGYTSGSFAGTASAGDKDAVVARVSAAGELLWSRQFGGAGEDKALALTAVSGGVVVGGIAGQAMPGQTSAGGYDGWVALLAAGDGATGWLRQVGTSETDQVSGLVTRSDGSVVAIGHTGGALAGDNRGENDVFATALDLAGDRLWTVQPGSAQDDRGVTATAGADGAVTLVATSYGALGNPVGGNDLAAVTLAADGSAGDWQQFGSPDRDGADEWDEANLFAAAGADGSTVLSGLTFGAPEGATNAGAGDVFVMTLP